MPGMVFWPPEWPTHHYSVRKRKRGVGKCSPRPEIEQGGRAGVAASMASGGAQMESGKKLLQESSVTLDSVD